MNDHDEYATERAAFRAGATIQAYTVDLEDDHGDKPYREVAGLGYWRDLDGEPQFSCHPSRYRVKPEDVV